MDSFAIDVDFRGRRLVGAPAAYVTGEDNLQLVVYGSVAGVVLTIAARVLSCDGDVLDLTGTLAASSDRTIAKTTIPLAPGWLTNLAVYASTGSPLVGQCFVAVRLVRGLTGAITELATLAQGYVTGGQRIAWPGSPVRSSLAGPGAIRSVQVAAPAAGAELAVTVPDNARWRLHTLTASLVASATVATRSPRFVFGDGTNELASVESLSTIAAGETGVWSLGAFGFAGGTSAKRFTVPIPAGIVLPAGATIASVTTAIDAGDQWSAAQLLVEEWIELAGA